MSKKLQKVFFIVKKSETIKEAFYKDFKEAEIDADDSDEIIECEIKEITRYQKGGWQKITSNQK